MDEERRQAERHREDGDGPAAARAEAFGGERGPRREERNRGNEQAGAPPSDAVPGPPGRGRDEQGDERDRGTCGGEADRRVSLAEERLRERRRREEDSREEEDEAAIRPDEEAPEPLRERVREALPLVAREEAAEAVELERDPRRDGEDGAGRGGGEPPPAQRGRGEEREKESGRHDGEARLDEERRSGGEAGPEGTAPRGARVALARGAEREEESAREGGRLERLGEVGGRVGAERPAQRREEDGEALEGGRGAGESRDPARGGRREEDPRERREEKERLRGAGPEGALHGGRGGRGRELGEACPHPVTRDGVGLALEGARGPLPDPELARLDDRDRRADRLPPVGDLPRVPVVGRQEERRGDGEERSAGGTRQGGDGPGRHGGRVPQRRGAAGPGRCRAGMEGRG